MRPLRLPLCIKQALSSSFIVSYPSTDCEQSVMSMDMLWLTCNVHYNYNNSQLNKTEQTNQQPGMGAVRQTKNIYLGWLFLSLYVSSPEFSVTIWHIQGRKVTENEKKCQILLAKRSNWSWNIREPYPKVIFEHILQSKKTIIETFWKGSKKHKLAKVSKFSTPPKAQNTLHAHKLQNGRIFFQVLKKKIKELNTKSYPATTFIWTI